MQPKTQACMMGCIKHRRLTKPFETENFLDFKMVLLCVLLIMIVFLLTLLFSVILICLDGDLMNVSYFCQISVSISEFQKEKRQFIPLYGRWH
jgi:hypothetical protein